MTTKVVVVTQFDYKIVVMAQLNYKIVVGTQFDCKTVEMTCFDYKVVIVTYTSMVKSELVMVMTMDFFRMVSKN